MVAPTLSYSVWGCLGIMLRGVSLPKNTGNRKLFLSLSDSMFSGLKANLSTFAVIMRVGGLISYREFMSTVTVSSGSAAMISRFSQS